MSIYRRPLGRISKRRLRYARVSSSVVQIRAMDIFMSTSTVFNKKPQPIDSEFEYHDRTKYGRTQLLSYLPCTCKRFPPTNSSHNLSGRDSDGLGQVGVAGTSQGATPKYGTRNPPRLEISFLIYMNYDSILPDLCRGRSTSIEYYTLFLPAILSQGAYQIWICAAATLYCQNCKNAALRKQRTSETVESTSSLFLTPLQPRHPWTTTLRRLLLFSTMVLVQDLQHRNPLALVNKDVRVQKKQLGVRKEGCCRA